MRRADLPEVCRKLADEGIDWRRVSVGEMLTTFAPGSGKMPAMSAASVNAMVNAERAKKGLPPLRKRPGK